jgi:hypothetical protein
MERDAPDGPDKKTPALAEYNKAETLLSRRKKFARRRPNSALSDYPADIKKRVANIPKKTSRRGIETKRPAIRTINT